MASAFERWRALDRELRANPWVRTLSLGAGGRLRRRTTAITILGVVGFALSVSVCASLALSGEARIEAVAPGLILCWIVIRAILMGRASGLAARHGRMWMESGPLEELYLTPVTPRELVMGWALAGWIRAVPEALAVFAILYPWCCLLGPAGVILPWLELIVVVHFQFVAALVASNLTLKFAQRREAVSAGWVSCTFVYPMVYVGRAALALFILVPIGAATLGELVVFLTFAYLAIAYFALLPFMAFSEIRRQLELTRNYSEGMSEWLAHYERLSRKKS